MSHYGGMLMLYCLQVCSLSVAPLDGAYFLLILSLNSPIYLSNLAVLGIIKFSGYSCKIAHKSL